MRRLGIVGLHGWWNLSYVDFFVFLAADTKVDAIGFVSPCDEEWPLSTLNLIKNLSRLKVPIFKSLET